MRAKIVEGKVKIDNDAMDVPRTIQVLKDGAKGESSILSGLDKAIQALYRAGYQSEASNAEDVKRNAKSIFTFMKKEIDWLQ